MILLNLWRNMEKQKATYEKKLQKAIDLARETKEVPEGVHGLVPDGERTVSLEMDGSCV